MKHRVLGKDLEVSAVGLGCMGMSHAYGSAPDKMEMTKLIAQAVDLGYTFFDTATTFDRSPFMADGVPVGFILKEAKRVRPDGVWLIYEPNNITR